MASRSPTNNSIVLIVIITIISNVKETVGQSQLAEINSQNPTRYTHYEVLDSERKYVLEWTVNWAKQTILFNVTVQARGYVGFGLSAKGRNDGADIVIGGVDRFGQPYFTDQHGVGPEELRIDPSQDWQLHSANENGTHTFLSFSRAFDTCDEHDYPINERDTVVLIWLFTDSDDTSQHEIENRGEYPVYLLEPNVVPRSIKMDSFIPGPPPPALVARENLQLWTATSRYQLPALDTTYHCIVQKYPRLTRKHHVVGYQIRLESEEALKHVHHIGFFRCNAPHNTTAAAFFERYVNYPGQQCYLLSDPVGEIPTQYCTTVKHGYLIGGRIMFYPDHYGIPIGETGTDEYVLMQTHYDNPDRLSNVTVEINIDMYYTSQLRPNDGGIMTYGQHLPGSPSILIPPQSTDHYIHGHCSAECTKTMFPPEGVFWSMLLLHTHNSGFAFIAPPLWIKVRVRHFRGNDELPWISDDENYSNTYQAYRLLNREVNVRPGDQITVSCEFDNSWTNGSVVGGYTTKQEMCLVYAFYYNVLPEYGLCRSEISSQDYMKYYLGVNNVTWDNSQVEYVATSPQSLAGMSLSTISDTQVDWTKELRTEIQEDHRNLPQTVLCSPVPFSSAIRGTPEAEGPEQSNVATIPDVVRDYAPPSRQCSLFLEDQFNRDAQQVPNIKNEPVEIGRNLADVYWGEHHPDFPFWEPGWTIWG